jgi:hypothetical protein
MQLKTTSTAVSALAGGVGGGLIGMFPDQRWIGACVILASAIIFLWDVHFADGKFEHGSPQTVGARLVLMGPQILMTAGLAALLTGGGWFLYRKYISPITPIEIANPLDNTVLIRCGTAQVPLEVPQRGWNALYLDWGFIEGTRARGGDLQPSEKTPGTPLNMRPDDPKWAPLCKIINYSGRPLLNVQGIFSVQFFQQNEVVIGRGVKSVTRGEPQGGYDIHMHNINLESGAENAFEFFVFNDALFQFQLSPPKTLEVELVGGEKRQTIKVIESAPLNGDPGPKRPPPKILMEWRAGLPPRAP